MPSKLHKSHRRRQVKKGETSEDVNIIYSETTPTGETKVTSGGIVPVYETKNVTKVLPKGTKGKEVFVYKKRKDAEGKKVLKKVKRKYKTKDAVYKSKTKVIQHGKYKGRVLECKGPGAECGSV